MNYHSDEWIMDRLQEHYEEALTIFPKDKNIFLMCGAGGYAGSTKEMLVALGWDENKIYNIGGYWYYNGNNNVEVNKNFNILKSDYVNN